MTKKIVVIGSGFAGLWTAIGAKRVLDLNKSLLDDQDVEVLVVAPEPKLVIRPRLYEPNVANMSAPLEDLFAATGVRFIQGIVHTIRTKEKEIEMVDMTGVSSKLSYNTLVLAAGSRGFTGIELATELPRRLRAILGLDTKVRVIIVERADVVGPSLGDNVRPIITKALEDVGAEVKLGATIKSVDADGIVTTAGERIEALSVVWTVGMEASPLTQQIPGEKDSMGRLIVDRNLRVPSCTDVFATGDAASARADDVGNYTLVSCQHAIPMESRIWLQRGGGSLEDRLAFL
ncbi:hypothetical protein THAR02_02297 [Trichoderma harzianum]|uniref:FAD/NAD(P)-binding domain-containing protein n=1 Tax=Trichoderma harzianum TaxID=5544 RepID=A0A0F9XLB8_TRIHA|nr:hypothetical protein THAR02_02297 [Trichoderma harzianum]